MISTLLDEKNGSGALVRTPKAGGANETLVPADVTAFALDDVSLFWSVKKADDTASILRRATR